MNIAKWERSEWMRPKVNSWQVGVTWGYQMVPTNCIITLSKNTFQNTSNGCKAFQNISKHDECSKSKVKWGQQMVSIIGNTNYIISN